MNRHLNEIILQYRRKDNLKAVSCLWPLSSDGGHAWEKHELVKVATKHSKIIHVRGYFSKDFDL